MTASLNSLTLNEELYTFKDIKEILEKVRSYFIIVKKGKVEYYNAPVSFDCETTSFFQLIGNGEQEKVAIMYAFAFSICGYVVVGRKWSEFLQCLSALHKELDTTTHKRLVIYVHNLAFDFSFFRKWLQWEKVFALKERTPIYALTVDGIEFRCSYLLSGYNLSYVAKNLRLFKIEKLVGDLDYNLIRHSETVITEKEWKYIVNDVNIVVAYIAEKIIEDGNIGLIPMTKTGYIREYCRNMCFYPNGQKEKDTAKELLYRKMVHKLNLTESEYYQLKNGFQGGFTHSNPFYVNKVVENVHSFDFVSSYPGVIVAECFPMSSSILCNDISLDEFNYSIKNYCCLFELELFDVYASVYYDNYISRYRCRELENPVCANGRIVSAKHLKTTVTEQDYIIITQFYKWGKMRIANFRKYKKGYLPTDFIKAVLKLYSDKTVLKGVEGKEVEYMKSKEMINSCYGMMVTDIVREEILYINNQWEVERDGDIEKTERDREKEIIKYNKNKNRFLFYPWGVWVTAYARRNLFTAIKEFKGDYIYSDTDSVKVINIDDHIGYIERYNNMQMMKLQKAMAYHKINQLAVMPLTQKGTKKILGTWDYEGCYKRFKTLGAKRYMVETERGVNITVSGLNKSVAVPYIIQNSKDPFEFFTNKMSIPGEYTGKQTHTYIDDVREGYIVDYKGKKGYYYELSSVHLCNSPYCMGMSNDFVDYIKGLKGV